MPVTWSALISGPIQMRDESGNVDTPDYFEEDSGVVGAGIPSHSLTHSLTHTLYLKLNSHAINIDTAKTPNY